MAKILLVEDDINLSEIYQARMEAEGYQVAAASDGENALAVAAKEKPDLIISDVMMPKISGFEMLDILRNTEGLKHARVIMLTALGQAEDKTRADSLGADKYLVKSQVTLEDIVSAAKELLGDTPAPSPAELAAVPATASPAAPSLDAPAITAPAAVAAVAEPPAYQPQPAAVAPAPVQAAPAEPLPATSAIPLPEPAVAAAPVAPATEPMAASAAPVASPPVVTDAPQAGDTSAATADPTTIEPAAADNTVASAIEPPATQPANDEPAIDEVPAPLIEPLMPDDAVPAAAPGDAEPPADAITPETAAPAPVTDLLQPSPATPAPAPNPALLPADPSATGTPPQAAEAAPADEAETLTAATQPEIAVSSAAIDANVVANAIDKLLAKTPVAKDIQGDVSPAGSSEHSHQKVIKPLDHPEEDQQRLSSAMSDPDLAALMQAQADKASRVKGDGFDPNSISL